MEHDFFNNVMTKIFQDVNFEFYDENIYKE